MKSHRIRLTDKELELVCAALAARIAGVKSPATKHDLGRLLERLLEGSPGNPAFRLGWRQPQP